MLKILQARLQHNGTKNFQMFKLGLEKAEEPEIKLPTSAGSHKKQGNSKNNLLMLHWLCKSLWLCSVQSLSCVWLFAIPWTAACRVYLSLTISQSLSLSNSCPLVDKVMYLLFNVLSSCVLAFLPRSKCLLISHECPVVFSRDLIMCEDTVAFITDRMHACVFLYFPNFLI